MKQYAELGAPSPFAEFFWPKPNCDLGGSHSLQKKIWRLK